MNDDEQRWAEAEQILHGTPDDSVRQGISRRRARFLGSSVAALVILLGVGFAVGWTPAERDDDAGRVPNESSVPAWVEVVGFSLVVVGLLLVLWGIYQVRRGRNWRWNTPLSPLSRAQKRSLHQQIIGKAPVDPARLPLARDLARRIADQHRLLFLLGGVFITQLGTAIMSPSTWRFAFVAVLALGLVAAVASMEREARRAREFLERNPVDIGA